MTRALLRTDGERWTFCRSYGRFSVQTAPDGWGEANRVEREHLRESDCA